MIDVNYMKFISFSTDHYTDHSEWQIVNKDKIRLKLNEDHYVAGVYPNISVELTLKRRSTYYVMVLLLPTILIGCLSLLMFYLPPESGK